MDRPAFALVCAAFSFSCRTEPAPESRPRAAEHRASSALTQVEETGRAEPIPGGTPYIPPQCYTKTQDASGRVHNPCFTCHADAPAPNYIRDAALQREYDFGPAALTNRWTNLFVDRSAQVAAQSDVETLAYVRQDNYGVDTAGAALSQRLRTTKAWDVDQDGAWSGFAPDIAFQFDDHGFDRRPGGEATGWRAYAYFPLPGTFWPTNGSFGDALIRLPDAYRQNAAGEFDERVYAINLAILEATIARRDVAIDSIDEKTVGVDLDGDRRLARARLVRARALAQSAPLTWVGRAQSEPPPVAGLFPVGTELAHSVRYLDVVDGRVRMAARMKELRYMVKRRWVSYGSLEHQAIEEAAEKSASPDKTRLLLGDSEHGIDNGAGWRIAGLIEDADGSLRPQTLEEHAFCIGCHSGVGVTDDSVFSFGRKLGAGAFQGGWYHWSQRGLENVPEPRRADGRGEYSLYLTENGAGDELRANDEVLARFFADDGAPRKSALDALARDVTTLLLPSAERALTLDKAYRVIVREQSYAQGRDATVHPAENVHRTLPAEPLATGVRESVPDRRLPARRALLVRGH